MANQSNRGCSFYHLILHGNLHGQVHGDRFSRRHDLVFKKREGSLEVKYDQRTEGEWSKREREREPLFLIVVMMSKSIIPTHHSTRGQLLQMVHGQTKELCVLICFFFSFFYRERVW